MEFALHGLAEFSMLSKKPLVSGLQFKDLLSGMFTMPDLDDDDLDDL
jgi:magnesium chelatase subunit I